MSESKVKNNDLYNKVFELQGYKFSFVYEKGNAVKFRIVGPTGDTAQAVYIPRAFIDFEKGCFSGDLSWFLAKPLTLRKLKLAGY